MMNLSFKKKLIFVIFFIIVVPLLIFFSIIYRNIYEEREAYIINHNVEIVKENDYILYEIFDDKVHNVSVSFDILSFVNQSNKDRSNYLENEYLKDISLIGIGFEKGNYTKTIFSSNYQNYLMGILTNIKEEFELVYPYIYVSRTMDNAKLFKVYDIKSRISESENTIMYYRGKIVYNNFPQGLRTDIKYSLTSTDSVIVKVDKENYLVVKTNFENLAIEKYTFIKLSTIMQGNESILIETLLDSLVLVLLVLFLAIYLGNYFVWPLKTLDTYINELLKENYMTRIKLKSNTDYNKLFETFNSLSEQIQKEISSINERLTYLKNKNVQIQNINSDITKSLEEIENKKQDLLLSEQKSFNLINNFNNMIIILDTSGKIKFINDFGSGYLGYGSQDLIGKHIYEIVDSTGLGNRTFLEEILEKDYDFLELVLNKKDFHIKVYFLATTRFIKDEEEIQIFARESSKQILYDSSVKKRNEELEFLTSFDKNLIEYNSLETFLSKVSYEIDNSLKTVFTLILTDVEGDFKVISKTGFHKDIVDLKELNTNYHALEKFIKERKITKLSKFDILSIDEFRKYTNVVEQMILIPIVSENKTFGIIIIALENLIRPRELKYLNSSIAHINLAVEKARILDTLKLNFINSINSFANAMEAKDKYTEGHSSRVALISKEISEYLEMGDDFIRDIYFAGVLHDIGKIGIPYGILTKEGKLTFEEYEIIKKHSEYGYQLIKDLKMLSDQIKNSVRFHHKRFDLKGYPEEHLEFMDTMSSIIGIADAIDAMTSKRKYNNIMTNDQVITELIKNSGTQFDPEIVEATVELIKNNGLDNLIQEVKDGE